ncbi:inositol monophosphatase family protein [Psychromarinibacter sp. C21-152]|uniref:Inositol monophosphatase family protein n=1 Tax=Psychromarinibacter sediminicola TaxID=3033385 RepID=A0AAE3NM70_9RHOB|nr:inositol monophosphatase family protein [Psychromarinibacter sediminicola]MDF0599878.1 inositol monophosphatase family protein [Psychromarinibacter sediminicola]
MRQIDDALREALIATAEAMADAARAAILPHFRADGLSADNKAGHGFDPVTVADRDSEQAMRAVLADRRPEDGILGEEYGDVAGTTGLTWVIDPIDGTRAFMSGTPTWGVLIAVSDARGPVLGLIDQPYIGERFLGGLGEARLDGPAGRRVLKTRAPRPLPEAILFTTFPEVGTPEDGAAFRRVADRARLTRYGMDCYAYALLAAGQIDLVIEAGLHAYDIQGPMAVIEAAGGLVTDWRGAPCPMGGRVLAAANPEIHAEALALLQA